MSNKQKVEIWKDIEGFEGLYQVSNTGKVKSLFRYKRELKPGLDTYGYLKVLLVYKEKRKTITVHRLVALHFVKGFKPGLEVNHKDGNKLNNNNWNLEWCTTKENHKHAAKYNLKSKGDNHWNVKIADKEISKIRSEYKGRGKGPTLKELGNKYGIKEAHACAIINQKYRK